MFFLNKHYQQINKFPDHIKKIFEELLMDSVFMGAIPTRTQSNEEAIEYNELQQSRLSFFELILYHEAIIDLISKWICDIKTIINDSLPRTKGKLWLSIWASNIENRINNYLCSFIWFHDLQERIHSFCPEKTQHIVGYFLIKKTIDQIFAIHKEDYTNIDSNYMPKEIIVLDPAENYKFEYISGWILYKLICVDTKINAHLKKDVLKKVLQSLCEVKKEIIQETLHTKQYYLPTKRFMVFMYKVESLTLDLFKKASIFGPNILLYINNNQYNNCYLINAFQSLINNICIELDESLEEINIEFLFKRIITFYNKSRQKTWRETNDLVPEKGTASLRENLKMMRSKKVNNNNNNNNNNNKKENVIKKTSLSTKPNLALNQLRIWAELEDAKIHFTNTFQVTELIWLLNALGVTTAYKRKNFLVPLLLQHLKANTPFKEEVLAKNIMFNK